MAKNEKSKKNKSRSKAGNQNNKSKSKRKFLSNRSKSGAKSKTSPGAKSKPQRRSAAAKVRINDLNGRFVWVSKSKAEKIKQKRVSIAVIKKQKSINESPLSISSFSELKEYTKKKRLRDEKGRFIKKAAQDSILNAAEILERKKIPFKISDLLKEENIQEKDLIIQDAIPAQMFYYDIRNKILTGFFKSRNYQIIDFLGNEIFSGSDFFEASEVMEPLIKRLHSLTKLIEEKEKTNPYFTVSVYEKSKGMEEILNIRIDFSGTESILPPDIWQNYKPFLNL